MAPAPAQNKLPAASDPSAELRDLWLDLKTSVHTRRAYLYELARFGAFVGKPWPAVTLRDLTSYRTRLQEEGLRPASAARAFTAIKSFLSFAFEAGYVPVNVGVAFRQRPDRDTLAQRILSEEELAGLLTAPAPGRDAVLLRLLYSSGVRVSEVAALRWADTAARTSGGQITVTGKGGRTRTVLLGPGVWEALQALRAGAGGESPVFLSRRGGALDVSQIRRIVYRAAERAGIGKKVSPHWIRHAHASHALDHGAPIHLVQATLGHASIATTGRYLHARPADSSSLYLKD